MPFNAEDEAEKMMEKIEKEFPPSKCSLEQYRDMLEDLGHRVRERISQLDNEIG